MSSGRWKSIGAFPAEDNGPNNPPPNWPSSSIAVIMGEGWPGVNDLGEGSTVRLEGSCGTGGQEGERANIISVLEGEFSTRFNKCQ